MASFRRQSLFPVVLSLASFSLSLVLVSQLLLSNETQLQLSRLLTFFVAPTPNFCVSTDVFVDHFQLMGRIAYLMVSFIKQVSSLHTNVLYSNRFIVVTPKDVIP
jgi:hypothetical protein